MLVQTTLSLSVWIPQGWRKEGVCWEEGHYQWLLHLNLEK